MDEHSRNVLPPLPASDQKSFDWNRRDGFYGLGAREFWGQNQIIREELRNFEKCDHFFEKKGTGVECKKCHFGLIGYFEINNGKLFYKEEPLEI